MSIPEPWLTAAMVAEYLGDDSLATTPNLIGAVTGVRTYLEVVSPFLQTDTETGDVSMIVESVQLAGILWAAHAYQLRSAPSGFAGYGEGVGDSMFDLSLASNRADIWRLSGMKRPIAL
jgi:hypothetical protein